MVFTITSSGMAANPGNSLFPAGCLFGLAA
jgi:hypothetical protein